MYNPYVNTPVVNCRVQNEPGKLGMVFFLENTLIQCFYNGELV